MKIVDINGRERDCAKVFVDGQFPGYVTLLFDSKRRPGTQYKQWMKIPEFLEKNPTLTSVTSGVDITPAPDITSVATQIGKDTLQDSTQNWETNDYTGYYVWIIRGAGKGQLRTVLSCTHNTLKIDKPWDKPWPDTASQYVLTSVISKLPKVLYP